MKKQKLSWSYIQDKITPGVIPKPTWFVFYDTHTCLNTTALEWQNEKEELVQY